MRPISSHFDGTSLVNKGFIIRFYFELKITERAKCGNKFNRIRRTRQFTGDRAVAKIVNIFTKFSACNQ